MGIIFGQIPVYFPGIPVPLKLGLAGGPLIIAILIGRFGHLWKLIYLHIDFGKYDGERNWTKFIPCLCRY